MFASLRIVGCSLIAVTAILFASDLPAFASPQTISCPMRYVGESAVPPGWWSAKRNEPDRLKRKGGTDGLDGIWIVEGKRGEELVEAPAILAPDRGSWDLSASMDGILLVCLYRGREEILATSLLSGTKRCSWRPQLDAEGLIKNGVVSCR